MASKQRKTGILLINLGTPEDTSKSAIRRYLREFLSDPRVVDIHPVVARWVLLNVIILPFCTTRRLMLTKKFGFTRGSPLW
jgi:ferrochelatase